MAPKEVKAKKVHKPRNHELGTTGIMRFSRARMYKKRGIWALKKKGGKKEKPKKETRMKKKEIGGEKNGGSRIVRAHRLPKSYSTEDCPRKLKSHKKPYGKHKRCLRSSITPGTVLILLAGRHRGKRVIFLKQLSSGLLLVNGPFHLNGCPLRRVNQIYVLATSTKLNISNVKLPERLNDEYFRRQKLRRPKQTEGQIFDTKKETYTVSPERKEDQADVDRQLLDVIKVHPQKKVLSGYLGAMFSLCNKDYPHLMKF